MATSIGANVTDPPKHGPRNTPDFITRDTDGAWHVIECKGTQSGNAYRNRQLGNTGPPVTGAVAQKRTISFPSGCAGQRLACGLMLAVQGDRNGSSLRVIDPPADKTFVVDEESIPLAVDTLKRATASRTLRLAGFSAVSSAVSLPWSTRDIATVPEYLWDNRHREGFSTLIERGREQLKSRNQYDSFHTQADTYIGREVQFDLATPVGVQAPSVRSLLLRYGVTVPFLDEIAREFEEPAEKDPTVRSSSGIDIPGWHQMLGQTRIESDQGHATMRIGSSFFGEIHILN